MATMELPLGGSLRQYIERNMFKEAYNLACFGIISPFFIQIRIYSVFSGVLDNDLEELASKALENLDLVVAKLAYAKLEDYNNLELVKELQVFKNLENSKQIFDKTWFVGSRGKGRPQ